MALVLLLPFGLSFFAIRFMDALYWRGESQATPLERKIQAGDSSARCVRTLEAASKYLIVDPPPIRSKAPKANPNKTALHLGPARPGRDRVGGAALEGGRGQGVGE